MEKKYFLKGLDCPHCSAVIEREVGELETVSLSAVNLVKQTLTVDVLEAAAEELIADVTRIVHLHEPDVEVIAIDAVGGADKGKSYLEAKEREKAEAAAEDKENRIRLIRLIVGTVIYAGGIAAGYAGAGELLRLAILVIAYVVLGYDVVWTAIRNITRGQIFDEHFLMSISTIGAFGIGSYTEAVAVMLFYQIGELFQDMAVGKSRKSIAAMMDIRPDEANVIRDGQLVTVRPEEVSIGEIIQVRPGERIPLDGTIINGSSMLDTVALTGESVPRSVAAGDQVLSGCINETGVLEIRVEKEAGESTAAKIIDMVENAASRKAPAENFITTFARYYTPVVVALALLLALVPPLAFDGEWAEWLRRCFVFLVISCPCALVISIPLTFFGGIGAASRKGVLVKGSNYLEALNKVDTICFDKTGTLTKGTFMVTEVVTADGVSEDELLELAAAAEGFSNHPIARSIVQAHEDHEAAEHGCCGHDHEEHDHDGCGCGCGDHDHDHDDHDCCGHDHDHDHDHCCGHDHDHDHDHDCCGCGCEDEAADVSNYHEISGKGVSATVNGHTVLAGNIRLMTESGIDCEECSKAGTKVYVAADGKYMGCIVIADEIKADSAEAIAALKQLGIKKTVMLTGDDKAIAEHVAETIGIDEFHAELLPGDKVSIIESLMAAAGRGDAESMEAGASAGGRIAFIGDGINDAPVLARADVGIAMGALGSDAAVEAADVVLMQDNPSSLVDAITIAKRTKRIVMQNITFALGVKFVLLALGALGIAGMWAAVFGDVGVMILAVLNSMRMMRIR